MAFARELYKKLKKNPHRVTPDTFSAQPHPIRCGANRSEQFSEDCSIYCQLVLYQAYAGWVSIKSIVKVVL